MYVYMYIHIYPRVDHEVVMSRETDMYTTLKKVPGLYKTTKRALSCRIFCYDTQPTILQE